LRQWTVPMLDARLDSRAAVRARPTAGATIASVAAHVPDAVVDNHDIAQRLGVSEDWIEGRTGIRRRHVVGPGERLDDLAVAAGRAALARAGIKAAEVDLVLVGTTSADELTPNAAPLVAHRLGARIAGTMDIGAACTAFVSALALGAGMIESRRAECALVVGADVLSRHTDPFDRRTAALFGDGAGAVVLTPTYAPGAIGPVTMGADGTGAPHIVARRGGPIEMAGQETFRNAVQRLAEATLIATARAGLSLEEIDLFVYHQANGRILRAVGERLDLDSDRVVDCMARFGNTSAATLPIALDVAREEGRLEPGDRVLLAAFGAGFTWGGAVVEWSES
jgi:3-oxoacyl-[acyl-carrier-protein] synthase III